MSIDAIKAVVDLIEMGGVVGQEDIVKCLRSAIEQAEKQEPVCDKDPQGCWNVRCQLGKVCKNAAPPQRQPLTEEEIDAVCAPLGFGQLSPREVARAIERKHGIGGGE